MAQISTVYALSRYLLIHLYIGTYMQLLDAVSRIATLGVETSYRQTVALMIRGYYSQISTGGSVERKTSAPKSRTEYVEVYFSLIHCSFSEFFFSYYTNAHISNCHCKTLAAGFLTIASGLMNTKLRADYLHRLLSLCSDVGLTSESRSKG